MRKTVRTLLWIVLCTLLASCGGKKEKKVALPTSIETAESQDSAQGQSESIHKTDNSGEGLPVDDVLVQQPESEATPASKKETSKKATSKKETSKKETSKKGASAKKDAGKSGAAEAAGGSQDATAADDVSQLPEYPVAQSATETGFESEPTVTQKPAAKTATRTATSGKTSSSTASRSQSKSETEARRKAEAEARAQAKREAAERKEAERQAAAERKAALEAEVAAARAAAGSGLIHTGSTPYAALWGENSTQGSSDIEVIAPRNKDVVVIIRKAKTNEVVRHAYVARGETCVLTLPEGFYQTFFYYGTHWSARKEIKPGMMGGFRYGETYDKDKLRKLPAGIVRTYDLSSTEEETETVPSTADEMF